MAKQIVYRFAGVVDFVNRVQADVCNDDRLSLLMGARQELERMPYPDLLTLRDAALALSSMVETALMEKGAEIDTETIEQERGR